MTGNHRSILPAAVVLAAVMLIGSWVIAPRALVAQTVPPETDLRIYDIIEASSAERIEADFESAGLTAPRLAMLRYAIKLTRTPAEMVRGDVNALRDAGFADNDILELCEVIAYYAYANRIADGLGVTLEK